MRHFTDVKNFLSNEVNRTFIAIIAFGLILLGMEYLQIRTQKNVLKALVKLEKKVDFRYFNITRSLEDINHIEIDTRNGKITEKY